MGWRGLPPSQLWLPWQRTAAAAAESREEEGGAGGWGKGKEEKMKIGSPSWAGVEGRVP